MSGTSLDGLDLAYCIFRHNDNNWSYAIEKAETIAYGPAWKDRLRFLPGTDTATIQATDIDFGEYIGKTVHKFIKRHGLSIDFVASHGHTIFHDPSRKITLQIGNGERIAAICGLTVVNDFRSMDVSMGGQGAPLVPIGDRLLFSEYDYCLNLGGIANISYEDQGRRIAFDICPVNMVLNMLAGKLGKPYDDKGRMARSGSVARSLLEDLESLTFYKLQGPRSLGREWVEENVFSLIEGQKLRNIPDLLATCTEHLARRLSAVCSEKDNTLMITGGGAFNDYLIDRIKYHFAGSVNLPDNTIIEYKEAMIFAFLGLLRLEGINNVLGSVTGSGRDHCAGEIIYPLGG